jgi:ribosomal-protein-alanine N-acetyltransferase
MNLTTARLCLRPIELSDAAALFSARGDPVVMKYWDWPAQRTVSEIEAIVREHVRSIANGETLWWVVAKSADGPAIGECDLSEIDSHHRRAEVGFLFAQAHWGRGYAFEAMQAVLAHAFGGLALERLLARCHVGNTASVRLLERLGFAYEGRLCGHVARDGARRDCLLFGRLR